MAHLINGMADLSCMVALTSPELGRESFHHPPLSLRYRRQGHHNDGKIPVPREIPSHDLRDCQIQSLGCAPPVMKDGVLKEPCFEFLLLYHLAEMAPRRVILLLLSASSSNFDVVLSLFSFDVQFSLYGSVNHILLSYI